MWWPWQGPQINDTSRREAAVDVMRDAIRGLQRHKTTTHDHVGPVPVSMVARENELVHKTKTMELLMRCGCFGIGAGTAMVVATWSNVPRRYFLYFSIALGSAFSVWGYRNRHVFVRDELLYTLPTRGSLLRESLLNDLRKRYTNNKKQIYPSFLNSPFMHVIAAFYYVIGSDVRQYYGRKYTCLDSVDALEKFSNLHDNVVKQMGLTPEEAATIVRKVQKFKKKALSDEEDRDIDLILDNPLLLAKEKLIAVQLFNAAMIESENVLDII